MTKQESNDRQIAAPAPLGENSVQKDRHLIVGIGASAGGLEALEAFFSHLPVDSGMSFVVVTHQQRGHANLLPELLARVTQMPVVEASEGTELQRDRVYLSQPGHYLEIHGGRSYLTAFETVHAVRLPIDRFFLSLAEDRREQAICIILSGTGSDGTSGLRAIKAEQGMAMVQRPQTARFAGMPSGAIATGLADYVLSPAEMPDQLIAYAQGSSFQRPAMDIEASTIPAALMQEVFMLLRSRTGHDFSAYKSSTIRRRIQRRMHVHEIEQPSQYVRFLRDNPHETDILFNDVLISVTSFFRDNAAWDALAAGPLPTLLRSRPAKAPLRAWVPGCATGEEVYSLAILLQECMNQINRPFDVKIFGTDLDGAAIEMARHRLYPDGAGIKGLPERLQRHLVRVDGAYCVRREIREMAVFAPHNVIKDPPFTKLDILCCRNLFIYLNADLQMQLLSIFHYALNPGGLLFLGSSETIGNAADQFETLDNKWKIFRRRETASRYRGRLPSAMRISRNESGVIGEDFAMDSSPSPATDEASTIHPVKYWIERLMLTCFCPPSVFVDERGEIVHVHGRTGMYLEPPEGQPRMNIVEMAREGLKGELSSALRQANTKSELAVRENVRVKTNGDSVYVNLSVTKLADPEAIRGLLMVSFFPVPPAENETPRRVPPAETDAPEPYHRGLEQLQQSHQITVGQLQSANEELKSTNEELQSTNEELQSANEELETSREELQSLNEELTTVNGELQSKLEELSHANDDMQNLLNSTDVATLFLDNDLNISRFTESIKNLINLRQSDVGRPVWELSTRLQGDHLVEDCRETLRTLKNIEHEVTTTDEAWHMMRILPYRTTRNVIEGVVVTFVSIDQLKMQPKTSSEGASDR